MNFTWDCLRNYLNKRFLTEEKNDVVIVVAEGAGQDLLEASEERDASGNKKLLDIGLEVKRVVGQHMKSLNIPHTVKYVDPSYTIRSAPANTSDCIFCIQLGQMAAHAAMAGRTETIIARMHGQFVHVPMQKAVESRKEIDIKGWLYETLLDSTGQPEYLCDKKGKGGPTTA